MQTRFFQHLEPGDNLGKITKLKYIDDISDDEMILYYFEDGTKCSSEFVAGVDDEGDPIENRMVMVELAGPQYPWKFTKKEVIAEVSKMVKDDGTGEIYEAVGPDVHLNRANGGNNRSIEEIRQNSIKTEVHRPKRPSKYIAIPDDEYLLSEHPDLENMPVKADTSTSVLPSIFRPKKKRPVELSADYDFDDESVEDKLPEVKKSIDDKKKALALSSDKMDLNMVLGKMAVGKINVSDGDWKVSLDKDEFRKRLSLSSDDAEKLRKKSEKGCSPFDACLENEDILVKNMIDKSKKKAAKIKLAIQIELPPKEIYSTIKDVYEDGMADEFIKSVTARISMDKLLESLSAGMKEFYEGSTKSDNK